MRFRSTISRGLTWLSVLLLSAFSASADLPAVGTQAPDFFFTAGAEGDTIYRLADYAGRQGVVVAWFPKAFTPG